MADIAEIGFEVNTADLKEAENRLERISRVGARAFSVLGRGASAFTRVLRTTMRMVFSLQSALLALGATLVVRSFINVARQTETLRLRLIALTGSSAKAGKAFQLMQSYAAKVPFTFEEIQQAGGLLLTVTNDVDEMNKLLEITGDIAAATGLTFRETAEQLQRSFAAGINSADRFRERGVRALLGFEAGVNITAAETRKHILAMWDDDATNRHRFQFSNRC